MEEFEGPQPDAPELSTGPVAAARQAASVMLLRGGEERLELLLVQRTPKARFMGGVWVFPGGAVDAHEGDGDASHRVAAVRELEEEANVPGVHPDTLVKYSQWITPERVSIRFDTHFFLAELPDGVEPRVDGEEVVDLGWFSPDAALRAGEAGEIELVFPTIRQLEQLAGFPTASALLSHARAHDVVPIQPRIVVTGETARILLPGDAGYDEA